MAMASGLIGRPYVATLPEKTAGQAGLYKYTVQASGLEGNSALGQAYASALAVATPNRTNE